MTTPSLDPVIDLSIAEGRLKAVREVADWLHKHRGSSDAGRVYADVAELKLRTALGEHRPEGPCPCPCAACPDSAAEPVLIEIIDERR